MRTADQRITSSDPSSVVALALALSLGGAATAYAQAPVVPKPATEATARANGDLLQQLPFSDRKDYDDAMRGFIAALPDIEFKTGDGRTVWDLKPYDFLKQANAPTSVNPSLWRISQLNLINGLFKVTDGVYQIRGFDLSNMTIVEGNTGLIIVDPLISEEMAKAGLDLYYKHRPQKPVVAVIYSHSHVDHYGGVKGVASQADVDAGKIKIYAPDGFLEEAVSENVFAGNAMSRRALYMYGALLPKGPQGQVDGGLGKTTSIGTVGLIPPTEIIKETGEQRNIDGIDVVFQMAPGTEAPSEMLFYFVQYRALCAPRMRRTPCTTSIRSGARRCATPTSGGRRSTRRLSSSATGPTSCSRRIIGRPGANPRRWPSSKSSVTCSSTSTISRCNCSTRATSAPRSAR